MTYTFTAAATLLALMEYLAVTMNVGKARMTYGVKAPAVTGDVRFECAYRVQMNMLEQMAFFLPSLWLCALLLSDKLAAALGLVWIVGRALYSVAYIRDPSSRGKGMMISSVAAIILFLGAVIGLVKALV